MNYRPRNQRTCHCKQCGIGFLTFKATAFCGSACRHEFIAINGTTLPTQGATQDGASNTRNTQG
jgi:hypothetical protein